MLCSIVYPLLILQENRPCLFTTRSGVLVRDKIGHWDRLYDHVAAALGQPTYCYLQDYTIWITHKLDRLLFAHVTCVVQVFDQHKNPDAGPSN